ncbi:LEAF RUST 10 DISEASE-RESISTANCE LOCUS RECEPTOR-LIKE PROTEIN KINASE-like 1.2 isoform X1 [Neltuma alba]|uniref:LEAF RUST 10 DISEASE-RESISTANCE LOCUS RECEPTOR-LIKE PROTEIN KINASE-like 1.2 isoform X1 n=1 Tax=Neltuma alba TaxID=207710 RepID=UPI0010A3672E|nr:LEAF RUST 10 DISEASE-RESISTANCE LOCUS RECEPTOR-LIKE PROTEIN KINASE-like 1.2 isoform X1 [Prosopis alba]
MNPMVLFVILLFCVLVRTTLCYVNPHFQACEPQTCGNGPNITYPFHIHGKQESLCGFPGFGLLCASNGFPTLNVSNTFYIVDEISYHNLSLRVFNPNFLISNSTKCLSPSDNLTLDFRYAVAPNQEEVLLFFDCDLPSLPEEMKQNVLGCSEGNRTRSVLGMAVDDAADKLKYAKDNCRGGPTTRTVVGNVEGGIREALGRGLLLKPKNWTASKCETCRRTGGRCGFLAGDAYDFKCFCRDRDHRRRCRHGADKGTSKLGLALGLGVGLPGMITMGMIAWWWWWRRRKYGDSDSISRYSTYSHTDSSNVYFGIPVFSYSELEAATNHFDPSTELGDGGFGTVYYGKLEDGREVAVKRLYEQHYKQVEQFMNEVRILTRLHHKNLVTLYGCTSRHSRELLLVYEFIPNRTVAHHLHLHRDPKKPTVFPWSTRMKIAVQTARALVYLHASEIIHRDIKTNNILLDEGFNVKVADFGLSRLFPNNVTHVSTAPQGTPGYLDPEYHSCYQLTSKSDVYSFGVVLIELITSMEAVDMSRDSDSINLSSLAVRKIQRSELSELVDPSLGFERDGEVKRMVILVAQVAFQCLQTNKELRPSMEEVLEMLERIQSGSDRVQEHPRLPPESPKWDEVGLLKNANPPPYSPNSVADKWGSETTTPNVSA